MPPTHINKHNKIFLMTVGEMTLGSSYFLFSTPQIKKENTKGGKVDSGKAKGREVTITRQKWCSR